MGIPVVQKKQVQSANTWQSLFNAKLCYVIHSLPYQAVGAIYTFATVWLQCKDISELIIIIMNITLNVYPR